MDAVVSSRTNVAGANQVAHAKDVRWWQYIAADASLGARSGRRAGTTAWLKTAASAAAKNTAASAITTSVVIAGPTEPADIPACAFGYAGTTAGADTSVNAVTAAAAARCIYHHACP